MQIFDEAKKQLPVTIIGFRGRYFWLSNEAPSPIKLDSVVYPTVAHAFAASATLDTTLRAQIKEAPLEDVRDLLRYAEAPINVRPNWDAVKLDMMGALLKRKFEDPKLLKQLLATEKALLVHSNDNGELWWGVCGAHGKNMLGRLLMLLREQFAEEAARKYHGPPNKGL